MGVLLRIISLILVATALMLLGADVITSLDRGGQVTVRSIEQVWMLLGRSGPESFKIWIGHSLPTPVPNWIDTVLALPAWAPTGVVGVVLAFLFGRRASGEA